MCFLPVALLWGELFTHVLFPQNLDSGADDLYHPDLLMGYVYKPGAKHVSRAREYTVAFNINSLGLRDHEYQLDATRVFRILLMGDSFSVSAGLSLEESLPKQIERYLQAELNGDSVGRKVQVINGANAGYTPYQYWKGYRRWKSIFHPDLVLVGLFLGNDYNSDDESVRFLWRDGRLLARYKEGEIPKA
jgi:hypothetical protein